MHIIEYRYRSGFRQRWTEWKEHHAATTEKEARGAVQYLERMERQDRADGMLSRWEETQYRVAEVME